MAGYAAILDEALFKAGYGSADDLARGLAQDGVAGGEMSAQQIAVRVSRMRHDPDGVRGFNLVCGVAAAVPEVLEAIAERHGYKLVPLAEGSRGGGCAAGGAALRFGELLNSFLAAFADGVITPEELEQVRRMSRVAEVAAASVRSAAEARVAAAE